MEMSPTQLRTCRRGTIAALLCVALVPAAVSAQNWDVAATAGVGIPLGDLSDTHDPGFSASLSTTRWMAPRYGIRIGGAMNMLGGKSVFPDADFWHYNVGPEFHLLDPASKLKLLGTVGLGGTTAQFSGGSDQTDFTVNAGLSLEYPIGDSLRIMGGPSFYAIFSDPNTGYILPITAGIRYLFSS
jgi:hypothetical protein